MIYKIPRKKLHEAKVTDYVNKSDLDKFIKNNFMTTEYEIGDNMIIKVVSSYKFIMNESGDWEVYPIDSSGKVVGKAILLK